MNITYGNSNHIKRKTIMRKLTVLVLLVMSLLTCSAQQVLNSYSQVVLDPDTTSLVHVSTGEKSVDFENGMLFNQFGTGVADYQNQQLLYWDAGVISVDWYNGLLYDDLWSQENSGLTQINLSVDWINRILYGNFIESHGRQISWKYGYWQDKDLEFYGRAGSTNVAGGSVITVVVNFSKPTINTNYAVVATLAGSSDLAVISTSLRKTNGFTATLIGTTNKTYFDYIVRQK